MREAIRLAAQNAVGKSIRFFAIGDTGPTEQAGAAKIEFLPYRDSMAACYQASDVYLHAAKAEAWGMVITEAMACGTPAIGLAVGGSPDALGDGELGICVEEKYFADAFLAALTNPPTNHLLSAAVHARFSFQCFQEQCGRLMEPVLMNASYASRQHSRNDPRSRI